MALATATIITALAGTRLGVSFFRVSDPGMAPSRLNAKVIREAEVMQDVAQKNCADAEMKSTNVAQSLPKGLDEDRRDSESCQGVVRLTFGVVRDREHHAQQQDVAAEHGVEDRPPDALGRRLGGGLGLLGEVCARRRSR